VNLYTRITIGNIFTVWIDDRGQNNKLDSAIASDEE